MTTGITEERSEQSSSSPPQSERAAELTAIYRRRFSRTAEYRDEVWQVLTRDFFSRWVSPSDRVLDLGCGYGEFINNIVAREKFAMDLNPDARARVAENVKLIEQDCSTEWAIESGALDIVFSSNFFEHLPNKKALKRTLAQAHRALREGGRLVAMGPNIKVLRGRYWDFFDHHLALTELSLAEALEIQGFQTEYVLPRFLPYTLVNAPRYPLLLLRLYLKLPWLWRIKGRQFLIVAKKVARRPEGEQSRPSFVSC